MAQKYQLFIDGTWRDASDGATLPAINPYNQDVHAHIAVATVDDVAEATRAARRAFDTVWSKTTPGERAKLLNTAADLLDADADRMAMLETTDNGKVIRETHSQMGYAARIFRYYAGWADKMHGDVVPLDQKDTLDLAIRVPYGVVACVTACRAGSTHWVSRCAGPSTRVGLCTVFTARRPSRFCGLPKRGCQMS